MELHINTINCKLHTDNPKLLSALEELYSFKVPGAEYSPQYKTEFGMVRKSFSQKKAHSKQDFYKKF